MEHGEGNGNYDCMQELVRLVMTKKVGAIVCIHTQWLQLYF